MIETDRRQSIAKTVKRITSCEGDYSLIHQELKAKRLRWWRENKEEVLPRLSGLSLVRQAYQLLLLEYMSLDPEEVPVVYEDEGQIVWRSFNFCPVIEACSELGLDTRRVCKGGYEESVQDLITQLDSRLRFRRSYDKIRPSEEYCEETIELC